jgi:hypothetical protein
LVAWDVAQRGIVLLDPLGEPEAAHIEHLLGLSHREHDA